MAFFEQIGRKITNAGQGVAQSTKNMADISRLNSSITEKKKHIAGYINAIGQSYYDRHKDDPDNEEPERVANINRLYEEIRQCEEEIKVIRGIGKCPSCGADVPNGATFCNSCGAKMPAKAPAVQPGTPVCANCQSPLVPGNKFCIVCGAPVPESASAAQPGQTVEIVLPTQPEQEAPAPVEEAPAPNVCPVCGAPREADMKFCTNCGSKLE